MIFGDRMFDLDKYINNIAVITDAGEVFTYSDINRMQSELFAIINGRKLVVALCSNTIGSLIGYICFINNSIVPIMLDKNINLVLLKKLLNNYNPDYLWVPNEFEFFKDFNVKCTMCGYKLIEYNSHRKAIMFKELALLLTTSGTTGSPKLVRLSYKNVQSNTSSIISYLDICENERAITVLPMSYTYGLSIINTHLYSGACILLTDASVCEKRFWRFFNEYRGTSISGVPYTYEMLRKVNFANFCVPSLKTMTQAGGKLSVDDSEYFYDFAKNTNRRFFTMYGQTEATARISYLPFEYMRQKKGSVGIPVIGGKFKIVDDNNNKLKKYEIGEIVYEGDNVSLGYAFDQYDLIKGDENKKTLHTGDMGYIDNDGFLYIQGRIDRSVKVLGNRINLNELEEIIQDIFRIQTICIYYEKKIYIFLTKLPSKKIKEQISAITGLNRNFFVIKVIKEFPRNVIGKVEHKLLMNLLF